MNKPIRNKAFTGTALALAASAVLTACGGEDTSSSDTKAEASPSTKAAVVKDPLVDTFDGGLYVLDSESLKLADTIELPGFNRLNPAGDDDHVIVSTDSGFRILNAAEQTFTGIEHQGAKPGHVVRYAGKTVLFTDGTGEVNVFDPDDLEDGKQPQGRSYTSAEPHHGVAVELSNGELLSTLGTEEKRTGVHGEAAAKGEAIGIGCEDGILIYKDGAFTKVDAPDDYGRIGNQRDSDASSSTRKRARSTRRSPSWASGRSRWTGSSPGPPSSSATTPRTSPSRASASCTTESPPAGT